MGYRDDPLWQALAAMRIEPDGAALTFAKRLARENGWSLRFAGEVLAEYHRFLYLAATGASPVTPSEQIDQVWHLHLAYTRHYWGVLCGEIIGRPLHHGPTAGGGAEGRKYRQQYSATLARYRDVFGNEPPSEIWPATAARFSSRYQWVDRKRNIIVPRRPLHLAGLGGAAFLVAACTAVAADSVSQYQPSLFETAFNYAFAAFFVLLLGFVLFVFVAAFRDHRRRKRNGELPLQRRRKRARRDGSGGSDSSSDGWSAGGGAVAGGGAAFIAGGGDFGGSGADGDWDSSDSSDSGSSSGDCGCSSSGCGGGCGGGD